MSFNTKKYLIWSVFVTDCMIQINTVYDRNQTKHKSFFCSSQRKPFFSAIKSYTSLFSGLCTMCYKGICLGHDCWYCFLNEAHVCAGVCEDDHPCRRTAGHHHLLSVDFNGGNLGSVEEQEVRDIRRINPQWVDHGRGSRHRIICRWIYNDRWVLHLIS